MLVFAGPNESPIKRKAATSIYYLITDKSYSYFHRLRFDETFHFYMGSPARMTQIQSDGSLREIILGNDINNGHVLQTTVPSGVWQGVKPMGKWALFGTQVAPGFDFADFELATRDFLLEKFPQHGDIITDLTGK